MIRDLQYGLRQIWRNKLFSATLVLLLAVGIGANELIFSFINTLLLKPLPVAHPDNLFLLERIGPHQVRPDTSFSYRTYRQLTKRMDLFSEVAAGQFWSQTDLLPMGDSDSLRMVMSQIVSPNYFSSLGIRAYRGRVLTASDATVTDKIPVVLSFQFWQSQFASRADAIGQSVRLKGHIFLIVGVSPREFHSIDIERAPDVRLPLAAAPILWGNTVDDLPPQDGLGFETLIRLQQGINGAGAATALLPQLQNSMESEARMFASQNSASAKEYREYLPTILQDIQQSHLVLQPVGRGISQLRDQFSHAIQLLSGGVALLLLAVCANIMGLLLAKSEERKKEIAVRLSVGASRLRLIRQILTEHLILAVIGACLGIILAVALMPLLVNLLPVTRDTYQYASARILHPVMDTRVLFFGISVTLLSTVLLGLVPAWLGARLEPYADLKSGAVRGSRSIASMVAIGVQVAIGVILLVSAALMMRTYWNLEHLNPGFDRAHIASFRLDLKDSGYSQSQIPALLSQLKQTIESLPSVRSAAFADRGLMRGIGLKMTVAPEGVVLPVNTFLNTSLHIVTPGYFETMGLPLLGGRAPTVSELSPKPTPVLVNKALADLLFPRENPIGKRLVTGADGTKPPTSQIVGVVATAKYRSMREENPATVYSIRRDLREDTILAYVRTNNDPQSVINPVRRILGRLAPSIPILEVDTLEQEIQDSLWQERLVSILSAFFGATALVLAGIGLYGALAYSVARRIRELGIRMAIGAQSRHVLEAVCGKMAWPVLFGLLAGVLAAGMTLRVARHLLYDVTMLDPLSYIAAAGGVLLCALMAAALPGWRAIRMNPSEALREE